MAKDTKYEEMLSKFLSKGKGKIQKKADGGDVKKPSFEEWIKTVPKDKSNFNNYDIKRAYKELPYSTLKDFADPLMRESHLPDTYKKPTHETFSDESIYSNTITNGGKWEAPFDIVDNPKITSGKKWQFTPSEFNLKITGADKLKEYFKSQEPEAELNIQKKADGGDIMSQDALSYGSQGASLGAAVGSIIPGVGTLIGGAVGAGAGVLGGLAKGSIDTKANNKLKASQDLDLKNLTSLMRQNNPKGIQLAEGGIVQGGGTGKSDSIEANVKPESFVIPVDTPYPKEAKLLMQALGANKEANLNSGTQPVKLSKGELLVDASQRSEAEKLLSGLGIQGGLASLAPNAKEGNKRADGGDGLGLPAGRVGNQDLLDTNDPFQEWTENVKKKSPNFFDGKTADQVKEIYNTYKASNKPDSLNPFSNKEMNTLTSTKKPTADSKGVDLSNNPLASLLNPKSAPKATENNTPSSGSNAPSLGTIAAVGQGVLGAANLLSMKGEPDRAVSPELKSRYSQAYQDAQYGMTNAEKQGISQDIEMNRRAMLDKLVKSGGVRSSQDALARAMAVGQQANRANLDLNVKDAQLKAQKQNRVDSLAARLAGEEAAVYGSGEHKYERDQKTSGALLQAGINNVVETDRLKLLTKDPEKLKALMDLMESQGYSRMTTGKH